MKMKKYQIKETISTTDVVTEFAKIGGAIALMGAVAIVAAPFAIADTVLHAITGDGDGDGDGERETA